MAKNGEKLNNVGEVFEMITLFWLLRCYTPQGDCEEEDSGLHFNL
jgi:hypothetical protein